MQSSVLKLLNLIPLGIVSLEVLLVLSNNIVYWMSDQTGRMIANGFHSLDEKTGLITILLVCSIFLAIPVFCIGILYITNKKYAIGIFHLIVPLLLAFLMDFKNLDGLF